MKVLYILLLLPLISLAQLKSFPNASGYGRFATGGRGGAVVFVTNLNTSGAGSFSAAINGTGARTIVFKVGGIIDYPASSKEFLETDNVTIAGETAPGGGITIQGLELWIDASNIIVRHIRFRQKAASLEVDCIKIKGSPSLASNIMIDHVSMSYGTDENFSITNANNVTLSNSIISDNFGSGAVLFQEPATNISFYQNLSVWNLYRLLRSSNSIISFEAINNLFYGHAGQAAQSFGNVYDYIGNRWENETDGAGFVFELTAGSGLSPIEDTFLYLSDNWYDNNSSPARSSNVISRQQGSRQMGSDIVPYPIAQLQDNLIANAGAYNGLTQGLDSYDTTLKNNVINKTGTYNTTAIYPTIASGTAYTDTDNDGMADDWETTNFGSLATNNNTDTDGDGYTNLEEFLHFKAGDVIEVVSDPLPVAKRYRMRIGTNIFPFFYLGTNKIYN